MVAVTHDHTFSPRVGIPARLLRKRSALLSLPNIPKNRSQFPRRTRNFGHLADLGGRVFPETRLCVARWVFFEPACEFFEDALPVVLAGSFAAERAVEVCGRDFMRH
jgi:hypothetical protein